VETLASSPLMVADRVSTTCSCVLKLLVGFGLGWVWKAGWLWLVGCSILLGV
jgi:hypothetical protein